MRPPLLRCCKHPCGVQKQSAVNADQQVNRWRPCIGLFVLCFDAVGCVSSAQPASPRFIVHAQPRTCMPQDTDAQTFFQLPVRAVTCDMHTGTTADLGNLAYCGTGGAPCNSCLKVPKLLWGRGHGRARSQSAQCECPCKQEAPATHLPPLPVYGFTGHRCN